MGWTKRSSPSGKPTFPFRSGLRRTISCHLDDEGVVRRVRRFLRAGDGAHHQATARPSGLTATGRSCRDRLRLDYQPRHSAPARGSPRRLRAVCVIVPTPPSASKVVSRIAQSWLNGSHGWPCCADAQGSRRNESAIIIYSLHLWDLVYSRTQPEAMRWL